MVVAFAPEPVPEAPEKTHYTLLSVAETCTADELKAAFRKLSLTEHPDKGGDDARFADLTLAYRLLEDPVKRHDYDQLLLGNRERALLVIGGPTERTSCANPSKKQVVERVKTAPRMGSTRSKKQAYCAGQAAFNNSQNNCAAEWKGMGSGGSFMRALCDETTPEKRTEELLDKFASLPRGAEKKREWLDTIRGKQKCDMKALAKKREAAERAKWNKWVAAPASAVPKKAPKMVTRAAAKGKPAQTTGTDVVQEIAIAAEFVVEPAEAAAEARLDDVVESAGGAALVA